MRRDINGRVHCSTLNQSIKQTSSYHVDVNQHAMINMEPLREFNGNSNDEHDKIIVVYQVYLTPRILKFTNLSAEAFSIDT